jgi:sigma-54 specific flagellar transcriptional regulator A
VESGEPVDEVEIAARSSRSDRAFEPTIDVEHAILLAQGGPALLPQGGISLKDHLADVERTLLEQALARTGGNVSQTARLLRIQRTDAHRET